jgi:PAS domain S-box-containing protein
MATEMRQTGIDVVGDRPWGTHFCLFYETTEDILDTLVHYCKAGLESQEFCLWVISEPLREEDARHALKQAVPDLDRYLADRSLEIASARDWYLHGGTFDLERVLGGWQEQLARALARGYAGVRVTGDTAWLQKHDWKDFCEYEEALNQSIANKPLTVLCTYPLAACGAAEILDVTRTHQFAVAKRHGSWEVIETSALKQAKAEIKRLNEELEQRVVERTSQLTAVNEELRKEILERKRAEAALRRSEAYLAEAQRLTRTGSWALHVPTRETIHSSEQHSRLFGFDPQEGMPPFDAFRQSVHPDDRARVEENFERAIREKTGFEWGYRAVLPDGTLKYINSVGHPVLDTSGDVVEMIGTNIDVTERKRADEELRESERRYRYIFDTVGVSIWEEDFSRLKAAIDDLKLRGVEDVRQYLVANPEFVRQALSLVRIVDVNDVTVRLFGAESKDELLVSLHKVFVPETHEVFVGEMVAIAEGRTSFEAETVLQTLKGERLTALLTITFPPPPGRFDSVLVTATDITERKRAEHLTRQVFETLPDGVFVVGRDYRYQRVNPVYAQRWEMPAERIVGMHVADLVGIDVFEHTAKPYFDRCFEGKEGSHAGWFTNASGRRYGATSFWPLRPHAERVEAALVITRDLSEHMLASEALQEAQAELAHVTRVTTLGEVTASFAHELNQPLGAIANNANACLELLPSGRDDLEEVREGLGDIVGDADRASAIIDRVRGLAQRSSPEKVVLQLVNVVEDVVALAAAGAVARRVAIRTDIAADLPVVLGDRVQLQQVLLNLVVNGMDAMNTVDEPERRLEVRGRPDKQDGSPAARISVQDRGIGLDAAQTERLFEAFYTTKPQGMGMGLAISRSIIEAHGGRLWAEPNPGPGATFSFSLPAAASSAPSRD